MSVLTRLIRKSPLVSFFVLAYVLSWWVFTLGVAGFPVFPFGPDIATLVDALAGRTGVGVGRPPVSSPATCSPCR